MMDGRAKPTDGPTSGCRQRSGVVFVVENAIAVVFVVVVVVVVQCGLV